MASPLPSLKNEQPIINVTIDPSAQLKSEEILDQLTALVKIHQDEIEKEERTSLPDDVQRKKNQVIRRQIQEQSSFSGQQERTQSLRNLSLGGIMKDTFADMRDQAMNRFRNNRFVSFARRAGNAYGVLTGRGPMFSGGGGDTGELSQKELTEKREGRSDVKEIIYQLEQLNEKFDGFEQSPEQKKEKKGFFRTIADAFLGYKLFDYLKNFLFGAGAVGAGAVGLKALAGAAAGKGIFAGAAAAAASAGAVLAKMGLFGAIAGGLIGTIGDAMIAWSNSETWKAGDMAKIIGSIFGGTGGGWSAAFRGIAGAGTGFLIGSALFPPFGGIIGAFLGGSLGAIAGFIGGQKIAEGLSDLGDWFSDGLFKSLKDLVKKFLNIFPDPNDERFPKELGDLSKSQDVPEPIRQQLDQTIEVYEDSQDRLIAAQKNLADLEEQIVGNVSNMSEEFQQAYRQARVEVRAAQRAFEETYRNSKRVGNLARGEQAATEVEQNPTEYSPNEKLAALHLQAEARLIEELRQVEEDLEKTDTPSDRERDAQILLDESERWFDGIPVVESLLSDDQDRIRQSGNDVLEEQIAQEQAIREQREKELDKRKKEINKALNDLSEILSSTETPAAKIKEILDLLPPSVIARPKSPPKVIPKVKDGEEPEIPEQKPPEANTPFRGIQLSQNVIEAANSKTTINDITAKRNQSYESGKQTLLEHLKIEEDFKNKAYHEHDNEGPVYKKDANGNFLYKNGKKIPKYAIGYGSSVMPDGREVQKGDVLLDRNNSYYSQLTDKEFEEEVNTKGREIAAEHMERRMDKFRDELVGHPEYGPIFTGIETQNRRNAILAMLYQMGQPRLNKFKDMFGAIMEANLIDDDPKLKQDAWDNVAYHMANSDWHNKQTKDRAKRVIYAAQYDKPLRDDKQLPPVEVPTDYVSSLDNGAEGHISYNPEAIVVGDYKGIKNNPEVTMPMSDLEERVLSTVTRMMNIRDEASIINNNVQMMNYESRMKSLLASSEQISKRVQAKDDLESAARTMTMPPIINSAVDNSNVSTTNQSVIVNRPVENRHNPFLTIT